MEDLLRYTMLVVLIICVVPLGLQVGADAYVGVANSTLSNWVLIVYFLALGGAFLLLPGLIN